MGHEESLRSYSQDLLRNYENSDTKEENDFSKNTIKNLYFKFFGCVLFLNNCKKKFDSEKAKQEKEGSNLHEYPVVSVNFNNPLLQQKLHVNERKDSSAISINNSNLHNSNNNSNHNKISPKKEKDKIANSTIFDFKSYFAKVEKMSKALEESFIKEREKCLTIVEIEDRPQITINSVIESSQNINNNQVIKLKILVIFLQKVDCFKSLLI